jgi:hypothetical protein
MPDSAYALYLQSPERTITRSDAALVARWGDLARTADVKSALALEADAQAEADRQLAFRGGPLEEHQAIINDVLSVSALQGRCITLDGVLSFVLGGDINHGNGTTVLSILRKPA